MSPIQSALLNWDLSRITRVVVSAVAVFLTLRLTDGFLLGVGVAVVLAIVLDMPWWLYSRYAARND